MSLADGAAYEKEFGLPEACKHLVEKSNCITCGKATDDGPEVEVIRAIRATHFYLDLKAERLRLL